MADKRVLSNDPLPEDELLDTLGVFAESEPTDEIDVDSASLEELLEATDEDVSLEMGESFEPAVGSQSRTVPVSKFPVAEIGLGKQRVTQLVPEPPDAAPGSSFYVVECPYTIYEPARGSFQNIELQMGIASADCVAYDLAPRNVTRTESVKRKLAITPSAKFLPFEVGVSAEWEREFEVIEPVITAYGVGQDSFGWRLSGSSTVPGSKHAFVVLEAPSGLQSVPVMLRYTLEWDHPFRPALRPEVQTEYYATNWTLSGVNQVSIDEFRTDDEDE